MIRFRNESVRRDFHLLTVDRQKELQDMAERFDARGIDIQIECVELLTEGISEIAIKMYERARISSR